MNYIDITMLVIIALGFLFGLLRQPRRSIVKFVSAAASIVISYFTFDKVAEKAKLIQIEGQSVGQFIINKISTILPEEFADKIGGFLAVVKQFCYLSLFVAECIALFIVIGLISKVFYGKRSKSNFIARLIGGIFNSARVTSIIIILLLPILIFMPIAKNVGDLTAVIPEGIEIDEATLTNASDMINNSVFVKYVDKFFKWDKNKLVVDESGNNLYQQIEGIAAATKALPLLTSLSEEGANPIAALKEMDEEDLTAVLTLLDDNKELIVELAGEETFADLGIDINEICFADEAPLVTTLLQAVEIDEEGEMTFDETKLEDEAFVQELAGAVAESELIAAVAEEGMLADIPQETKDTITQVFDDKLAAGDIDQEKYDQLMTLFTAPVAEG